MTDFPEKLLFVDDLRVSLNNIFLVKFSALFMANIEYLWSLMQNENHILYEEEQFNPH